GHSGHPPGVRDQFGMLSAISVERCPPSRRNAVRHHSGTVSAIAWNTQLRVTLGELLRLLLHLLAQLGDQRDDLGRETLRFS
ncbi:MAG TPA: hypothetical protein VK305_11925, partial [Roseateles sp.]|nr:hypothetical protein [Roseateles sp.]